MNNDDTGKVSRAGGIEAVGSPSAYAEARVIDSKPHTGTSVFSQLVRPTGKTYSVSTGRGGPFSGNTDVPELELLDGAEQLRILATQLHTVRTRIIDTSNNTEVGVVDHELDELSPKFLRSLGLAPSDVKPQPNTPSPMSTPTDVRPPALPDNYTPRPDHNQHNTAAAPAVSPECAHQNLSNPAISIPGPCPVPGLASLPCGEVICANALGELPLRVRRTIRTESKLVLLGLPGEMGRLTVAAGDILHVGGVEAMYAGGFEAPDLQLACLMFLLHKDAEVDDSL